MELQAIYTVLAKDILLALGIIVISLGIGWIKKLLGVATLSKIQHELTAEQSIARLGVMFVQQAFGHLDNQDKFDIAYSWLVKILQDKGFKVGDEEIEALIESSLKVLKKEFAHQWKSL